MSFVPCLSAQSRVGRLVILQIFSPNYFKLFSLVSELLMQSQIASRGEICPIQELNESLQVNLFFPRCWGFPRPRPLSGQSHTELQGGPGWLPPFPPSCLDPARRSC